MGTPLISETPTLFKGAERGQGGLSLSFTRKD